MSRKPFFVMLVLFVSVAILSLSGCSDDDDGGSMMAAPANPAFTGTFVGTITVTQNQQVTVSMLTVNLFVNSPLDGDFSTGDGTTGDISGDASGDSATFSATTVDGTLGPPCTGELAGNIELILNETILIDATGENCDGLLEVIGEATRISEICDDQKDNDNDDLVDCDDPDCEKDPACAPKGVCGSSGGGLIVDELCIVEVVMSKGQSGNSVCEAEGLICDDVPIGNNGCIAFHPDASTSEDFNGWAQGVLCNDEEGLACSGRFNDCHVCPACGPNLSCGTANSVLLGALYASCIES